MQDWHEGHKCVIPVPALAEGKLHPMCYHAVSCVLQVADITKEGWLHLKHTPHVIWELPELLSSEEAHSNLLAVSRLLQSHGAPHSALSHAAAECPQLFRLQAGCHAQGCQILLSSSSGVLDLEDRMKIQALWPLPFVCNSNIGRQSPRHAGDLTGLWHADSRDCGKLGFHEERSQILAIKGG